jgi:ATP-dependent 26S proteasome regulatory subunit
LRRFISLCLLVCALGHGALAADPDFDSPDALQKWLKLDNDLQLQATGAVSPFENGIAIAMDQLLTKAKWNAYQIVNYGYGHSFPKAMQSVQIGQHPEVFKRLVVGARYYFEKKALPDFRVVVDIGPYAYTVYYNTDKGGRVLAEEFQKDIDTEANENSVYRGRVLEFKRSGLIGFVRGLDRFKYTWDSIILDPGLKARIREGTDVFLKNYDRTEWKKYGLPLSQGVLMDGPPGTGKSLLGKILISNILTGVYARPVTYLHVQARHVSSTDSIRTIYQAARLLNVTVVFIEDIDLIAGTNRQSRAEIKNELMQQLSGLEALEGVLTIGTTNYGDEIDPALRRSKRLGLHYTLGTSPFPERVELWRMFLKDVAGADVDYTVYASQAEGLTGADIKQLSSMAVDRAIKERGSSGSGALVVSHKNVMEALELRRRTRLSK